MPDTCLHPVGTTNFADKDSTLGAPNATREPDPNNKEACEKNAHNRDRPTSVGTGQKVVDTDMSRAVTKTARKTKNPYPSFSCFDASVQDAGLRSALVRSSQSTAREWSPCGHACFASRHAAPTFCGSSWLIAETGVMTNIDSLPIAEFGFPGALRDKLVSAICNRSKTSTTSTVAEYQINHEPLPQVGSRQAVVDSEGRRIVIIETTDVEQVRLSEVPWAHARDEGEGYSSLAEWRIAHERFWEGEELRAFLRDPNFVVDDDTLVLLERFRVVD